MGERWFIRLEEIGGDYPAYVNKYDICALIQQRDYTVVWVKGTPDTLMVREPAVAILEQIEREE